MKMDIQELLNANELHMEQLLRARLDELGIAPNVLRILKGRGITTLKTLCAHSREELLEIRFLGASNVDAIERLLKTMDLKLKQ
jgi:DNA-directed RNA polymerase alpha subunit